MKYNKKISKVKWDRALHRMMVCPATDKRQKQGNGKTHLARALPAATDNDRCYNSRSNHLAEEALLWSMIPAAAPAGHGLPQAAVFEDLDETQADIVAALVTVNQRLRIHGDAVFLYQDMDCLQNEVQFTGMD
ncbi:MAG: hypothetical protein HFF17_01055 [Oscillospiraceae bacterium]|nr:hypothetical protein [Oscillospiraceae bacterium]